MSPNVVPISSSTPSESYVRGARAAEGHNTNGIGWTGESYETSGRGSYQSAGQFSYSGVASKQLNQILLMSVPKQSVRSLNETQQTQSRTNRRVEGEYCCVYLLPRHLIHNAAFRIEGLRVHK